MELTGFGFNSNWAKQFERKHGTAWTQDEILERVRRVERVYWTWCAVGFACSCLGAALTFLQGIVGLLSFVVGFSIIILAYVVCNSDLCMLHIIWDMRKNEEGAVRQSEIQDL